MTDRPGGPRERFTADWLALREPADAAARDTGLAARALDAAVRAAGGGVLVVHDLGCGSGSMMRWLAPRVPRAQRWVLHDHDPDLLARAAAVPPAGGDGAPVAVTARQGDLAGLAGDDLAGAHLVTTSALLDLLTAGEVRRVVAAVARAGAPALLTLSVAGRVVLDPADPLDGAVAAAFDEHQRRVVGDRRLLGPGAADAAAAAFAARGYGVEARPSRWRLGPGTAALIAAWFEGWTVAAAEQHPGLPVEAYRARRAALIAAGRLTAEVHHVDLLAAPPAVAGR